MVHKFNIEKACDHVNWELLILFDEENGLGKGGSFGFIIAFLGLLFWFLTSRVQTDSFQL